MKVFKRLLSIFLVMQCIASCSLMGHAAEVAPAAPCTEFVGGQENNGNSTQCRPKVSVIVPVYKVEPYLRECLDSIKNQTLKDIEIICVDDGSPDNCGKILDEYAVKDSRFIIIHQENKGPSKARNAGLEKASGEYITFVDADDYINLNTYEELYKMIRQQNADVLRFAMKSFTEHPGITHFPIYPTVDYIINVDTPNDLTKIPFFSAVVTHLYRNSLIKDNAIKFVEMRPDEDPTFNLMVKPHIKRAISTSKVYYHRRLQPLSTMQTFTRSRKEGTLGKSEFKDLHLCFNAIPSVCDAWRKKDAVKGNETYLLTTLIRQTIGHFRTLKALGNNYAKQILGSFGPDIYNPEVIKKCDKRTQQLIRELEDAAAHPEKYQDKPIPAKLPSKTSTPKRNATSKRPIPAPVQVPKNKKAPKKTIATTLTKTRTHGQKAKPAHKRLVQKRSARRATRH